MELLSQLNDIVKGLDPVSVCFGIFLVFFTNISFGCIDAIIECIRYLFREDKKN